MRTIENMNREELAAAAADAEFMRDYYLGRAKEARALANKYALNPEDQQWAAGREDALRSVEWNKNRAAEYANEAAMYRDALQVQEAYDAHEEQVREIEDRYDYDDNEDHDKLAELLDADQQMREKTCHVIDRRSHACYYTYVDLDDEWHTVAPGFPIEGDYPLSQSAKLNYFFRKVAEMIAMDDIYEIEVEDIVFDGRKCEYVGWQPGMKIAFRDCLSGEIVFEDWFPEWNH